MTKIKRLNIDYLTAEQKGAIQQAIGRVRQDAIDGDNLYGYVVDRHRAALHRQDLFLPWHRAYLIYFESLLLDRGSKWGIPYWSFLGATIGKNTLPNLFDEFLPGDRFPPDWKFCESPIPGKIPPSRDYFAFRPAFEAIHDQVHDCSGQFLESMKTSPRDPLFFALHSNVDRLWRESGFVTPPSLASGELPAIPFPGGSAWTAGLADQAADGYEYLEASRTVKLQIHGGKAEFLVEDLKDLKASTCRLTLGPVPARAIGLELLGETAVLARQTILAMDHGANGSPSGHGSHGGHGAMIPAPHPLFIPLEQVKGRTISIQFAGDEIGHFETTATADFY